MNRIAWYLSGLVSLGLAATALMLGRSFLPSSAAMKAKLGTLAPLVITWGMIWMTVVAAAVLAGFLFWSGMREGDSA